MSGWFAVKRGITSHPIFKGHPERLAIWLWLLDNAVWQDTPHDIKGHTVTIPRGSVCASERRIADEVGVGYQVVRTFLGRLKKDRMINAEVTHGRNVISLCNYEKYQSAKINGNAAPNAELTQSQRTKEQVNKTPPTEGASADPVKVMFDNGRRLLSEAGVSHKQAGSLLGKWRGQHGTEAVISALGRAQREGAIDPVSFIEGCFKWAKSQPQRGSWRVGDLRALSPTRVQEFWPDGKWDDRSDLTEADVANHPRFIGRAPAYAG